MRRIFTPRFALAAVAACLGLACTRADAERITLTVATFPDLDRAAKAAAPAWSRLHPDVELKILSLQYPDHHTAMTTALATGSGLPDVMAVDFRYIGKFKESGGLEDLSLAPYNAVQLRSRFTRYTDPRARDARGQRDLRRRRGQALRVGRVSAAAHGIMRARIFSRRHP